MASELKGSWFSSGYNGHFRSKSRNDFVCEYRQLARPQPPDKFFRRSKQPISKHVFSHHDNRHSFLNSALYFEEGLGRKRVPNSTYHFKPEFISWMPDREYVTKMRPLNSTYAIDFKKEKSVPQLIVKRPKTSFDSVPTTSYRYAHGKESPNRDYINAMNNEALRLTAQSRSVRAKSARPQVRETVASCLNWYVPQPPKKLRVPAATETMECAEAWFPVNTQQLSPPAQVASPAELSSPPVETVQQQMAPQPPLPPSEHIVEVASSE